MTPAVIEPASFRLVAQCLGKLLYRVAPQTAVPRGPSNCSTAWLLKLLYRVAPQTALLRGPSLETGWTNIRSKYLEMGRKMSIV